MEVVLPTELSGRKVLVMGLGAFGGGAGCARALVQLGAEVTVTDLRPAEALQEALELLDGLPIQYQLDGHHREMFEAADVVVVNPAVPNESKWLQVARELGCALTTEVNLALTLVADLPAIAITGTHGKSTCASLCAHLLEALPGTTLLAGNLGGCLLEQVLPLGKGDRLVVELSSFQTERLVAPEGWPKVSILTSFGSDHLERHHTVEAYAKAKRRLLIAQDETCTVLLPPDGEEAQRWSENAHGKVERLDIQCLADFGLTTADLPFTEPYRLPSVLAALHAARLLGLDDANLRQQIHNYSGLPHRMHTFIDTHGRSIIDNGVATHPEPTTAALEHLEGNVVLLAGGKDKGLNLQQLSRTSARCARLYLHGEGGKRLARECRSLGLEPLVFDNCRAAMVAALKSWIPGETILFSPTFSSYDEFRNFRDRARIFLTFCSSVPVDKSKADHEIA
ncbi:MAG: UDP-N-acetylmuramoyl-L-alanine--D-glutamate ligase [Planctomycetota bacterium]